MSATRKRLQGFDADRMEGVRGVRPRKGVFARPAAAADEIVGQIAAGDTRGPAWLRSARLVGPWGGRAEANRSVRKELAGRTIEPGRDWTGSPRASPWENVGMQPAPEPLMRQRCDVNYLCPASMAKKLVYASGSESLLDQDTMPELTVLEGNPRVLKLR